jgi:hypothetical protein
MMAGQRAALLVLCMTAAGSAAGQPASGPLPENPPNYRQIVKSLMRPLPAQAPKSAAAADAKAEKKPGKKPDPKAAATPAAKPDAAAETKPKPRKLMDRAETGDRITRIAPEYSWEISKPRRVEVVLGWSWQVCLKGKQNDKPFYLALFIQGRDVADARSSVQIDRCESESYEPL